MRAFYSSFDDKLIFEFQKEKGKIIDSDGITVLYLKGEIGALTDEDFFGIAGQFLELFA